MHDKKQFCLQTLVTLRHQAVKRAATSLLLLQQDIAAYQQGINTLAASSLAAPLPQQISALQLINNAAYQANVRQFIQQQQQQLVTAETKKAAALARLQQLLRQEKVAALALAKAQAVNRQQQHYKMQKNSDEIAMQCWRRR